MAFDSVPLGVRLGITPFFAWLCTVLGVILGNTPFVAWLCLERVVPGNTPGGWLDLL